MAAVTHPPVLSRGRHHWPSRKVCLMEYAAGLAGEPRSDSPGCTDPVIAIVARCVNDYSSDAGRQRLVELAPAIVRAHPDERRRYEIARRCVLTALAHADGTRRFVLAAAAYGVDRADGGAVSIDTEWALINDRVSLESATALAAGSRIGRAEHARRGMPLAIEALSTSSRGTRPMPTRCSIDSWWSASRTTRVWRAHQCRRNWRRSRPETGWHHAARADTLGR